jgi:hypothetical protein
MTSIRYRINQKDGWPDSPGDCGQTGVCRNVGTNIPLNAGHAGPAIVGRNRVMITASKSSSMKKTMGFDGPGYDESVEINMLPARYNVATKLEAVVAEDVQKNSFDFELFSE